MCVAQTCRKGASPRWKGAGWLRAVDSKVREKQHWQWSSAGRGGPAGERGPGLSSRLVRKRARVGALYGGGQGNVEAGSRHLLFPRARGRGI